MYLCYIANRKCIPLQIDKRTPRGTCTQARRQDIAARGPKTRRGSTF